MHSGVTEGRLFGESTDEFVEEFLCCDLKVKWIAAILSAVVQELVVVSMAIAEIVKISSQWLQEGRHWGFDC